MAILNGLIQKMKGSAGQLTFKSLNGQTVVSEGFRGFQRVSNADAGFRFQVSGFKFQVSRGGDEQGAMSSEQKKRGMGTQFTFMVCIKNAVQCCYDFLQVDYFSFIEEKPTILPFFFVVSQKIYKFA